MRRLVLCLGLLGAGSAPAGADAPFAPVANAPDHVVVMAARTPPVHTRTVTHHGDWTRVDINGEGLQRQTNYYRAGAAIEVQVSRSEGGEVTGATIERGREETANWDTEPRNTGERVTWLGESCTIWSLARSRERDVARLSCVTDDGIELWQKYTDSVTPLAEATRIERRPVTPAEVRPPRELFMHSWWTSSGTPASAEAPDYETHMRRTDGGEDGTRITRRHAPWIYRDEAVGGGHWVHVTNTSSGLSFAYLKGSRGGERLMITKWPPPPDFSKSMHESEQILGESCTWFDMSPGMQDASHHACRTQDGVTLKETHWSHWGGGRSRPTFTATRVSRRPISLGEVMPPAALLDPKYWGLD